MLLPFFTLKLRLVVLSCIEAGADMVMVMDTDAGLPATALPVSGSIAVIFTVALYVPGEASVASTRTFMEVVVPPGRLVPEICDSETKPEPDVMAAVQLSVSLPELPRVIA